MLKARYISVLKLKRNLGLNFIWYCGRDSVLVRALLTLCDMYITCHESDDVYVLENPQDNELNYIQTLLFILPGLMSL